jgi:hypothetical protein
MLNFLTYRAANPIFVFSLFDYDYLLVNKNYSNTFIGKIIHVLNVFFFYTKFK